MEQIVPGNRLILLPVSSLAKPSQKQKAGSVDSACDSQPPRTRSGVERRKRRIWRDRVATPSTGASAESSVHLGMVVVLCKMAEWKVR